MMASPAAVMLAALLLENQHLGAALLLEDLALDERALDGAGANLDVVSVGHHEHAVERNGVTGFALEALHGNDIVLRDAVLFAAGLDHCEHVEIALVFVVRVESKRGDSPCARTGGI